MSLALVSSPSRLAVLVATTLSLATSAAATWELTSVEDFRGYASTSALRFDPGGAPAIAYGEGALRYATFDGAAWTVETVAPGCAGDTGDSLAALAFDAGGNPAISYVVDVGGRFHSLRIARRNGTAWLVDTVDNTALLSEATSLAFDPAGNPAVAYSDVSNRDLRYASFDGSRWVVTTVDGTTGEVGEYPSLGFAGGRPVISYYDRDYGDLKAARFDGSTWQIEVVDGMVDAGRWSSLAINPGGAPAISYVEGSRSDVKYARYNTLTSTWDLEYTGSSGATQGTSLGFDAAGSPAIAYFANASGGRLMLDRKGPSGWTSTTVDSFRVGEYPSLALDPTGNPGISYFDSGNATIKFAHGSGGGFNLFQVDGSGPRGGSVAFDPTGNAALSYSDGPVGGLKFARFDGLGWVDEPVNRGFMIGGDSSLVFDPTGNPLIAYDDRTLGNLKLARWNGSSWVPEVVAAGAFNPTAPMAPSLALDPAGHPAISYSWFSGAAGFELTLARFDGSSWNRETIVTGLGIPYDVGGRALAFGPGGNPAVAFRDDQGVVKLATRSGPGWDIEVLDPGPGGETSLAFDGAGNPVVTYTSYPTPEAIVQVARRIGTTWQRETIASGSAGTVAIDPSGHPAVSYLDFGTVDVKLARWDGTTWTHEEITDFRTPVWMPAGTLAIAPSGQKAVVYSTLRACRAPWVALSRAVVHRGAVPALAPGWQAGALPLSAQNDDETPPFPAAVAPPGSLTDPSPPAVPLALYRVLRSGSMNTGNALRVVKGAGGAGVTLSF